MKCLNCNHMKEAHDLTRGREHARCLWCSCERYKEPNLANDNRMGKGARR